MMENADELYLDEVSNACETLEGLTETATENRERITALSVAFTEMVGVMKGHEVDESTGGIMATGITVVTDTEWVGRAEYGEVGANVLAG